MCYYNNRYIDSSYCAGGKNYKPTSVLTGFDNTVIGPTGPTGPTGPCCNSDNLASILNSVSPEVLVSEQMVTLTPDFIIGNSIKNTSGSDYITLLNGSYYISYNAIVSPSTSPMDVSLAFILNGDIIESSIVTQSVSSTSAITLNKSFLINIADTSNDIALINNSSSQISLTNLTISVIKVG